MGVSDIFSKLFDPYERQARLYPGLLVMAPVAVIFVSLAGANNRLGSTLVSVLVSGGVAYALGRVARDAGKRLQDEFFVKWGGAPTTQVLRHRDNTIDVHTKARYHKVLGEGIGRTLPTPSTEAADPNDADEYYRAATTWLLGQTRDTKAFALVFKENIAFGFQRNAMGLRVCGIVVSMLCVLVALAHMALTTQFLGLPKLEALEEVTASNLVALGASLAFLGLWVFWFGEDALKRTAFAYAVRLFESCDYLTQAKAPTCSKTTNRLST